MERRRVGFHQTGKIYQQDIFSWCISYENLYYNVGIMGASGL